MWEAAWKLEETILLLVSQEQTHEDISEIKRLSQEVTESLRRGSVSPACSMGSSLPVVSESGQ